MSVSGTNAKKVGARRGTASNARHAAVVAMLAVSLPACSGGGAPPAPTLQSIAIGEAGRVFAAVGIPLQLTVVGKYTDGTSATLTAGVAWSSSDESVASVDDRGRVSPWRKGDGVAITARHAESGMTASASLSTREVVQVSAGTLPNASVDTTQAYFRISGLQPGTFYEPRLTEMTDDVDLAVYGDMSMSSSSELCTADAVGRVDEWCIAPANPAGELWLKVDGHWTDRGATFALAVFPAPPVSVTATLAFPGQLPHSGSIGRAIEYYRITGLTPGARYEFRISQLSDDLDLSVVGDVYLYQRLCDSTVNGIADDFCTATVGPTGEVFVAVGGETTLAGGTYDLAVTAR